MPPADAPCPTGRTESQGIGITEAQDPPPGAQDAPVASGGMEDGTHMGRGKLPVSATIAVALEQQGRQVADAVARREFEWARELTEAAIRLRSTGAPAPGDALRVRGRAE